MVQVLINTMLYLASLTTDSDWSYQQMAKRVEAKV